MAKSPVERVAKALGARVVDGQFYTRAICHGDRDPSSLSVGTGSDGLPVVTCHAGCPYPKVREALVDAGVPAKVLRSAAATRTGTERREHIFEDENGEFYYRVKIKKRPDGSKKVTQQRWEHDQWISGLGKLPRILYGLPGVLLAVRDENTIHLTEGEKDADALNAYFRENGLNEFATCAGAAGSWARDEHAVGYLRSLRGAKKIVVWADRDEHGYGNALTRFAAVTSAGLPGEIRLPIPTGAKADVFDHLEAGHKPKDGQVVTEATLRDLAGTVTSEAFESEVAKELNRARVQREVKVRLRAEQARERYGKSTKVRRMGGAEFFMDIPDAAPVLWGEGGQILWIDGEPTLLAGDDGTGKSTIDHQLIAARLGILDSVLGYEVTPAESTVVYLAMDRPEQARRAGHRLFPESIETDFRTHLDRLAVWTGPLPIDPLESPENVADWLQAEFGDVSEVHVDSLKDLAMNLTDDGVGSGVNLAIQEVVSRGINWFGLHHQRKATGENKSPKALADVYGSRWLTAGHGSVLMLSKSNSEKDIVELRQVKEPADRIPQLLLRHDRTRGLTHRLRSEVDFETALLLADTPSTIREIAALMYPAVELSPSVLKKVERQANAKFEAGEVLKIEGAKGGHGGSTPAKFALADEEA